MYVCIIVHAGPAYHSYSSSGVICRFHSANTGLWLPHLGIASVKERFSPEPVWSFAGAMSSGRNLFLQNLCCVSFENYISLATYSLAKLPKPQYTCKWVYNFQPLTISAALSCLQLSFWVPHTFLFFRTLSRQVHSFPALCSLPLHSSLSYIMQ